MDFAIHDGVPLTQDESELYSHILEATSIIPKSDPRYAVIVGMIWWLLYRRRRMEQQLQRRRHFTRRIRRLLYLRWKATNGNNNNNADIPESWNTTVSEMLGGLDFMVLPKQKISSPISKPNKDEDLWNLIKTDRLSDIGFLQHFHMTKETFSFIYAQLEDHLKKSNTSMREPLPAKKRLAATLYRLATNAEYLKVAACFSIGKSTTTSLVRDVCEVIVSILKDKFLNLRIDENTIAQASNSFGISQAIGVLGSTDIFILGSFCDWEEPSPYSSLYTDAHALIFQAIVDHLGHFRFASASHPAGMSNIQALKESILPAQIEANDWPLFKRHVNGVNVVPLLLADESYGYDDSNNFSWILTEKEENGKVHEALGLFEEAMTKVKSRWKIFHGKNGKINFNADAFENIATACCILHNICEMREDPIDPSWSQDIQGSLFIRKGIPGLDKHLRKILL